MTPSELSQLYVKYGALIHRRCRSLLGSAADANDALQETFMRVQKYPPQQVTAMLPWLYSVATRVCFDLVAQRRRADPFPLNLLARFTDARPREAAATDTQLSVAQALVSLGEPGRTIAVLHHLDGLTQEEIVERVGLSRKTVGLKLRAAEEALRQLLEGGAA